MEKEIATYSSILTWSIPWTEEHGGLTVHGVTKSRTRLSDLTSLHHSLSCYMLSIVLRKLGPQYRITNPPFQAAYDVPGEAKCMCPPSRS